MDEAPTSRKVPPLLGALYALSQLINIFALTCTPPIIRKLLFVPIACIILHIVLNTTTGDPSIDNPIGAVFTWQMLLASDYLVLTPDLHYALQPISDASLRLPKPASLAPFMQRLRWAFTVYTNPRGVGWAHEPSRVLPPRPSPSMTRFAFVISRLKKILLAFVVYDVCEAMSYTFQQYQRNHHGLEAGDKFWMRVLATVGYGGAACAAVSISQCIGSIIAVGIFGSNPTGWPHLYGEPLEAYTLSRFWGYFWHQMLRRSLVTHARALLSLFRIPETPYVFVCAVFLVSGMLHLCGERMMYGYWNIHARSAVGFFLFQALGILIEQTILRTIGNLRNPSAPNNPTITTVTTKETKAMEQPQRTRRRPHILLRILGYAWVICWASIAMDTKLTATMYGCAGHASVITGLAYGRWVVPPSDPVECVVH